MHRAQVEFAETPDCPSRNKRVTLRVRPSLARPNASPTNQALPNPFICSERFTFLKIGQLHRLAGAINASDRNCLKVRGWITNLKFHKRKGSCHAYRSCAIHFTAPCPAMVPVAKQPCSKYPPVGASQSIISPAQNIPYIYIC